MCYISVCTEVSGLLYVKSTDARYRRTGFDCENLIVANCEFF